MAVAVVERKAEQLLALVALVVAARAQHPVMVIPEQPIWAEEGALVPVLVVALAVKAAPVS